MPPAKRGQGVCKAGFHKVRKTRLVCAKIGGRVCRSGVRLESGKCKRMPLTEAQKDRKRMRARRLVKATRMGERIKQKRMDSNVGVAFRAIKKAGRREKARAVAPAASSSGYSLRSRRAP